MKEIKGWHVLSAFVVFYGVIITVNLTLAFNAVHTFPGLEVKNSYVASQKFDRDRYAQEKLGWDVAAHLVDGTLRLEILKDAQALAPTIEQATLGRATHVKDDEELVFVFDGTALVAATSLKEGNLNLRLKARAEDGTLFQQRVIVDIVR